MADIKLISVTSCEPGMIVASDIINDYGAVILYKNSKLDEHSINKLKKMNIEFIKVFKEYSLEENRIALSEATYNNNLTEFKDVIWDISCGRNVEIGKVREITNNLTSNFESINDAIACLSKVRNVDEYTFCHGLNVAMLCTLLGKWLNMRDENIRMLTYAGLLHDIGKSKISPSILNKPDKLTSAEFEEMKKHPVYGYNILEKSVGISKEIAKAVLMHHEREDGSGYPFGITSFQIHEYAKIIAVVDVFDAMTSNKVYKMRIPPFDVIELYESEYLTKCDARYLMTFLQRISSYFIGSTVKLSNGIKAEIVYINQHRISRPLVRTTANFQIIDLSMRQDLKITELL